MRGLRRDRLRGSGCRVNRDRGDEAEAAPGDGTNDILVAAGVADGGSRGADAAAQRGVGDDSAVPNGIDQLVPGDGAVVVFDEKVEHAEDLRLHRNRLAGALQIVGQGVECELAKPVNHRLTPKISEKSNVSQANLKPAFKRVQ